MPERDYDEYELAGDTPQQLPQLLGQAVYGDLAGGEVNAAIEAIGQRNLALLLSGAESTRDQYYKSVRDKIRKWATGRQGVSAAGRAAMQGVAQQWRNQQLRQRGAIRAVIVATLHVSRKQWTRGKMDATLTGSDPRDFADALDRNDPVGALNIAIDAYNLDPNQVSQIDAIHSIDVY